MQFTFAVFSASISIFPTDAVWSTYVKILIMFESFFLFLDDWLYFSFIKAYQVTQTWLNETQSHINSQYLLKKRLDLQTRFRLYDEQNVDVGCQNVDRAKPRIETESHL